VQLFAPGLTEVRVAIERVRELGDRVPFGVRGGDVLGSEGSLRRGSPGLPDDGQHQLSGGDRRLPVLIRLGSSPHAVVTLEAEPLENRLLVSWKRRAAL